MTQSGYIAAFLLAAFVLYLAAKGRLTAYSAVLWGPTSKAAPATTDNGPPTSGNLTGGNSVGDVGKALGDIGTAAAALGLF